MNYRLPFQVHLFLGLVTSLLLGFLFQNFSPPGLIDSSSPLTAPTQYTYENIDIAWKVKVAVFADKPPVILSVEKIKETRISDIQDGKSYISLVDKDGENIYSQTFKINFLVTGLEKRVDERKLIFILPFIETARKITVTTPEGAAEYELPY